MSLNAIENQDLERAKTLLENPGLAARLTEVIGAPIEKGFELLPDSWNKTVSDISTTALTKASNAAIFTLEDNPGATSSNLMHKLGVAVSGGVGGFFGMSAIAVELPVSTSIMLRSIADVARSEGESIADVETKIACLEVFALGGTSSSDDASETGYFAVRTALMKSVSDAAEQMVRSGVGSSASPLLVKLIAKIAKLFGVQVSQKTAAQMLPAIGAAGGLIVNTLFIDHFQNMARGHFIIRRLEREHGEQVVRAHYNALN